MQSQHIDEIQIDTMQVSLDNQIQKDEKLKIKTGPQNDSDVQMSQTETMWRCPRC